MAGRVRVVGVGEDGPAGLPERARAAIAGARLVAGTRRHLALYAAGAAETIELGEGRDLEAALDEIETRLEAGDACVLVPGDPLFFGPGGLVVRRFGRERVEVVPHPTTFQQMFARIGLAWEEAAILVLEGEVLEGVLTRIRRRDRVAILGDALNPPRRVAAHLIDLGETGWRAWVGEDLGSPRENVRESSLEDLARESAGPDLSALVLERTDPGWRPPPVFPSLPDASFEGVRPRRVTPREVRAVALGLLGLASNAVVWDVGAGSGSLAAEAGLLAAEGRVYAIESDSDRAAACLANLRRHGADNVRVVRGRAPDVLAHLEDPDAVFVGGRRGGVRRLLAACLEKMWPGGRVVVAATTLEDAAAARGFFRDRGHPHESIQLAIARAAPGRVLLRPRALDPFHLVAATIQGRRPQSLPGS